MTTMQHEDPIVTTTATSASGGKIDVHAHFIPPFYNDYLSSLDYNPPDGMPGLPTWTPEAHLSFMASSGITKSILSLSSPGISLTNDHALNSARCRQVNEYASSLKRAYPTKFGFFATLPLADVESSLAEIAYAHSVLDCDGFVFMSNTLGLYLGDPSLRPILSALNAIGAPVFIHPTASCNREAGHHLLPPGPRFKISSPLASHYPTPLVEFFFDSARSLLDLVLSGTANRFGRIKWLASHAGNVIPCLIDRMMMFPRMGVPFTKTRDGVEVVEADIRRVFREQVWYDLAGVPVPGQVNALLGITGKDRLLVGSDAPWTPFEQAKILMEDVERQLPTFVGEEFLDEIWSGNAKRFLSFTKQEEEQTNE